jgi:uracil DNA glycosylase
MNNYMQVQLEKKKIMKWIANQILIMNKILIVNKKMDNKTKKWNYEILIFEFLKLKNQHLAF